ncbi:SDR family NAD(P)-dependent oxidoreductase [Acuticoccus mangrovi]|uniref:SDR family oxidoreductase n=1 Tax=Acuticoccus mangrovi TaxID=2796142 RepID=A0A934IN71_9HYPH|nr:SDR family oxidoreductase [Acuticoccus mangrovi]MBJ3776957.1 SDR family oxidoreductase [Acuticoccus mangrovi]
MSGGRFDLTGRTALVTGASRGIGEALAVGLAEAGADIVAVARHLDSLGAVGDAVGRMGRSCYPFAADVADTRSIDALFVGLAEAGLRADILVNNAGTEEVAPSLQLSEATWDKIVDTNLKGAFFVAQGFAAALPEARTGAIVNLGSLTSAVGVPTAVPYTASKTGILGITRGLAAEWAPRIRVNAIGPGYFRTALTEGFYRSEAWQSAMLAKIPMGRFGRLDDLVGVTVFLASDAAAYLTGQIVYVDGGTLATL